MKKSAHERFIESLYIPQKATPRPTVVPKGNDAERREMVEELNKIFDELFGDSEDDE